MTEAIRNTLDNKNIDMEYSSLYKKTFDAEKHDIQISTLEHYGTRGNDIAWFKSYPSDIYQYVAVNDTILNY